MADRPLWTLKEIKEALGDELLFANLDSGAHGGDDSHITLDAVSIDSRTIGDHSLFVAIDGKRFDGHDFAGDVLQKYAGAAALVSKIPKGADEGSAGLIMVKDTVCAMEKMAVYARKRSKAKIIAVTGSVGKTTVKDILHRALSCHGKTYATVGNLNNHFGTPLSLCNFPPDCQFGVFEIGMNHAGEIAPLAKMVNPHIAVITDISCAHIGNFKNEQEIAHEKTEIFSGLADGGYAVIEQDGQYYDYCVRRINEAGVSSRHIITFGRSKDSDVRALSEEMQDCKKIVGVGIGANFNDIAGSDCQDVELKSFSEGIVNGSLIAIAVSKIYDLDAAKTIEELGNITPSKGRGEIHCCDIDTGKKEGDGSNGDNGGGAKKKILVIDDTYNAGPKAVKSAIKNLDEVARCHGCKRKILALGDMLELGANSKNLHAEIGDTIREAKIDAVYLCGKEVEALYDALGDALKEKGRLYGNVDELIDSGDLLQEICDGDAILVKGSRGMKMEKVVDKILHNT